MFPLLMGNGDIVFSKQNLSSPAYLAKTSLLREADPCVFWLHQVSIAKCTNVLGLFCPTWLIHSCRIRMWCTVWHLCVDLVQSGGAHNVGSFAFWNICVWDSGLRRSVLVCSYFFFFSAITWKIVIESQFLTLFLKKFRDLTDIHQLS